MGGRDGHEREVGSVVQEGEASDGRDVFHLGTVSLALYAGTERGE